MHHVTDPAIIDRAVEFHGQLCPGLALGIQAARLALDVLGAGGGLVAVVENGRCSVDALQVVAGVTLGSGTLIHYDFGKPVYSFWRPGDGPGVRLAARLLVNGHHEAATTAEASRLLGLNPLELFSAAESTEPPPRRVTGAAGWIRCVQCGEFVMESHARLLDGRAYCAPCFRRMKAPIC